jgi:hypothetical protein
MYGNTNLNARLGNMAGNKYALCALESAQEQLLKILRQKNFLFTNGKTNVDVIPLFNVRRKTI